MHAFAGQNVRERDPGGLYPHPDFTSLRFRTILLHNLEYLRSTVVWDEDARALHGGRF